MRRPIRKEAGWRVTSPFGRRVHPVTRLESTHSGIDLGVPEGTEVLAPMSGAVTRVWLDKTYGGGLSLTLRTSDASFGFCHLSKVLVDEGAPVTEGQVVALSGGKPGRPEAGRSTGPHLHVSVRVDGRLVDPEGFFRKED